jgi:cysteine-rich repeat protein
LGGANDGLPCAEDGDCPSATCAPPHCTGGSNAGVACATDFDCPGGECGPGLFDFATRLLDGAGPVLLRLGACIGGTNALAACEDDFDCAGGQCGAFTLAALDPVPLDGLNQSTELNAFVLEEAIADPPADLNGDGDRTDPVVKLGDRATGLMVAIGEGGSEGRAVARVQKPPFSFPAVAVDEDLIAFLEPEPWQGAIDANANGRVFDTILKVYRLGGGELTDPMQPVGADAAPLLNDRSIQISAGSVFFRTAEAAQAAQATERVSVDSAGNQAMGGVGAIAPSLSGDGRYVAFSSDSPTLVADDFNYQHDVFVHDRATGNTVRVSVTSTGGESSGASTHSPFLSADGRHVVFSSISNNLVPGDTNVCFGSAVGACQDVFVHDRDRDADGIFDETGPGERSTVRASVASDGTEANGHSGSDRMSISADGRFVAFNSDGSNLVAGDGNGVTDVFVHDRDADGDGIFDETGPGERATVRLSVDVGGGDANGRSGNPSISADGRFAVFDSDACDLIPGDCVTTGDTNGFTDVFLRDRDADEDGIFDEPGAATTVRVSVDSAGAEGRGPSYDAEISADGAVIVFTSGAANLVAGDTNSFNDVFAYEGATGVVTALTVTPDGRVSDGHSAASALSGDGRFAVFQSNASNLTGENGGSPSDVYLHDRATRLTTRVHVALDGGFANEGAQPPPSISADGYTVAFLSRASDLVAGDTNGMDDAFVRSVTAGSGDLSGDGTADDVVLRVLDAGSEQPSPITDLCPAAAVAVAGGKAAFLRPETAGATPALAACPAAALVGGNPDLNGDGDGSDDVVHFWDGAAVQNLSRAATAVALSESWLAALVSEKAQGRTDLNGDSDTRDAVVQVHPAGAGSWTNVGQAADALALAGSYVAYITPERAQADADLNDDGDGEDRVLQTYDAATATAENVGQAAEELVAGATGLIAFRTLESRQGGQDLNNDGDTDDGVLQIYDAAAGRLLNSGQAVTPCRLEACDPRVPYRVRNDTVTFLTLEAAQGEDLNADGDLADLVLQVLNVRRACNHGGSGEACHTLAAASAGICTDTGEACAGDESCPDGECFVPPGGCLRDLGVSCNPASGAPCYVGPEFCQPILGLPGQGTCHAIEAACRSDADCNFPAFCSNSDQDINRLMDPLRDQSAGGSVVFTGTGLCTEDVGRSCSVSSQCEPAEFCAGGTCHRDHGECASDADCPTGSLCEPELVRSTADDGDLDELPDVIDNCPEAANVMQEDLDGDGIGDACDAETCGNGLAEESEDCDDGNASGGDGCEADCSLMPALVSGTRVIVRDMPSTDERSLVLLSRDVTPAPANAAQDPTVGGARLEMLNEMTGERALIDLPAVHWSARGEPPGSAGYKYSDPRRTSGPCKLVRFRPGRGLKAVCSGPFDFTLNEAAQGSLRFALRIGAGSGALKLCMRFGGTVSHDYPAGPGRGEFRAHAASAPASCSR